MTLEGDPFVKASDNLAYRLSRHLAENFNLESWPAEVKSKKLWPWGKDSMRELFKKRAEAAGFPRYLFGFHSLKSGASSVRQASNPLLMLKRSKQLLKKTSFVVGWNPSSVEICQRGLEADHFR